MYTHIINVGKIMNGEITMKLVICIVNKKYSGRMIAHLNKRDYRVTRLGSTGGFMKQGNDTLLIGVSNEDLDTLHDVLKQIVDLIEKEKGWPKPEQARYTSFVVNAQNFLPLSN